MRVDPRLYVEWVEEEAVVLDPATDSIHYLNGPAALTLALVQELGFVDAVAELEKRFARAPDMPEELETLLERMKEMGLLIDD